jgi:hypothetical protein
MMGPCGSLPKPTQERIVIMSSLVTLLRERRFVFSFSLPSDHDCQDVVRAALSADTFGMGNSLTSSSLRGPPEPAPKRPYSQYNTPLSHSPASEPEDNDISPPPPQDERGAQEEAGGTMTTIFRSPALEGERKPPLSPAPATSSSVSTPIAIRPQSDIH